MSLFGALSSGVSGLIAQSSAMGAISDNITNVSTIGYKNTRVDFQTLVTQQTSSTLYSPGGVQSKPRTDTGVQGLLQSSTSSTDLSLSGQGFFIVNEANTPTISDQFLYTRAGSFFQDNEGFLRNTAGFYLQAWPVDAGGTVVPTKTASTTIANQNIVSTDFLTTVNLSRVGGTATATSTIGIGANLPANDIAGTTHKTDVQFFDSLVNAANMSFVYTKSGTPNEWKLNVDPPTGTTHIDIEDDALLKRVYRSIGQLEFNQEDSLGADRRPVDGASVIINSKTYVFDDNSSVTDAVAQISTITLATSGDLDIGETWTATINGNVTTYTIVAAETTSTAAARLARDINANTLVNGAVSASASGAVITITSKTAGTSFTLAAGGTDADTDMTEVVATTIANAGTANTFKVDISTSTSLSTDVNTLRLKVIASDPDFDTTNTRIRLSAGTSTTLIFEDDGLNTITVDPTGLKDSTGSKVTDQTTSFTTSLRDRLYTDATQILFTAVPTTGDSTVINGITYNFTAGETESSTGSNTTIFIDGPLDRVLADLRFAIAANDLDFDLSSIRLRGTGSPNNNTLVIDSKANGSTFTMSVDDIVSNPTEPDGNTTNFINSNLITFQTEPAISFTSSGLPNKFNIAELDIRNFSNGAADHDDAASNVKQITIDFGTLNEANGVTQFGAAFTPVFINQNGSRFGTFAGLTVNSEGLMTALFDNGETRPIFQIPVATFVNVNGLESRSGNVFNATESSGDSTLRVADNGPAGQTIQGALEASTVDIGEEFTKMIVVQRAFSASAKIISTADDMLEELLRTKR